MKLLDKTYKYEMDPTTTVGTTEWTLDAGQMDRWTDRGTDGVKPISPQQHRCVGGIMNTLAKMPTLASNKGHVLWEIVYHAI